MDTTMLFGNKIKSFVLIFICLAFWLAGAGRCGAQVDSTRLAELDGRLEEYFRVLEGERIEVKNQECDLLIDSAKDSALRRHIALKIYDHYLESPVMGDEAVAIHLTDTWFAPGLIDMGGEDVLLNAKIYADFNRQSLLGMKAPSLRMETPEGDSVLVGGMSECYRLLFFYDTDCPKCKLETVSLRLKLNSKNWPIDFYAIYTGTDAAKWKDWRESKFEVLADRTDVIHLWDPEISSDYQMKYGVIQTPRMFLLDRSGTIIGRGLDTNALEQLLGIVLSDLSYEYGGEASKTFIDNLFASYPDPISPVGEPVEPYRAKNHGKHTGRPVVRQAHQPADTRILDIAKALESRTLAKGDTASFKHLEGDLLYWLTSRRDEACKEGTIPFVNEYILSRPGIWNTADDTLKVVGLAKMMKDLLSRTPVGSRLPSAKGLVREAGDGSSVPSAFDTKAWDRLRKKGGYIVFHAAGCPVCASELAAADSLGLSTLEVNVDEILMSDQGLGKVFLDTFDLSSMPLILEVSRRGVISRRYVSFLPIRSLSLSK